MTIYVLLVIALAHGFGISAFVIPTASKQVGVAKIMHRNFPPTLLHLKPLKMTENDKKEGGLEELENGFDGQGFVGYLLPYALTALASIVATSAFVKFVLEY